MMLLPPTGLLRSLLHSTLTQSCPALHSPSVCPSTASLSITVWVVYCASFRSIHLSYHAIDTELRQKEERDRAIDEICHELEHGIPLRKFNRGMFAAQTSERVLWLDMSNEVRFISRLFPFRTLFRSGFVAHFAFPVVITARWPLRLGTSLAGRKEGPRHCQGGQQVLPLQHQ